MVAFLALIWKAFKVRGAVQKLQRIKLNAYRESLGLSPIRPWYQVPVIWIYRVLKWILLNTFLICLKKKFRENRTTWDAIWTNGTLLNKTLKSFIGVSCGLIAATFVLVYLIYQLNFKPLMAMLISCSIGSVLSFGLAFSQKMRCVYCLVIPQFFTEKGRIAIIAYAAVMSVSGPGKNTAHNMEVLADSLVCTQEMVKESTSDLGKLARSPGSALKEIFANVLMSLKDMGGALLGGVGHLVYFIVSIVDVIKTGIQWLKGILEMCNAETGTPYDRCWKTFDEASKDCVVKLGSWFSWLCKVVDVFQNICYVTKIIDAICWLPSLVREYVFAPINKELNGIERQMKNFFYFKPIFNHTFDIDMNSSKSIHTVAQEMKNDILENINWVYEYCDTLDLVMSSFCLLVIWNAFNYLRGYMNSDQFDNRYITSGLVGMDLEREKIGKETIFPLKKSESKRYITMSSLALLKDEWKKLRWSLLLITLGSLHVFLYIFIDFGLYMFLELLREYADIQLDTRGWLGHQANVEGEGVLAEMYRILLKGLSPVSAVMPQFNTQPCLPDPHPPDYWMYSFIAFLLLLAYFAALAQPYAFRYHHVICGIYYPHRKVPRDRYLFIRIISKRGSFLKFARRKIKSMVKGKSDLFSVSLMDRLAHSYSCCQFLVWFTGKAKKQCFLCGIKGEIEDHENFIHCPICDTVYCIYCYKDLQDVCTACLKPVDYGDLSDISEELGSDSKDDSDLNIQDERSTDGDETRASSKNKRKSRKNKSYTKVRSGESADSESNYADSDQSQYSGERNSSLKKKNRRSKKVNYSGVSTQDSDDQEFNDTVYSAESEDVTDNYSRNRNRRTDNESSIAERETTGRDNFSSYDSTNEYDEPVSVTSV